MEKLKFGHRGGNQPVMNLVSRRVEITAQNHGFGLLFPSLGKLVPELSGGETEHAADGDLRVWVRRGIAPVVMNERFGRIRLTHVNLNDGTAEGIQLLDDPCFSVSTTPRPRLAPPMPTISLPPLRDSWTARRTTWTSTPRRTAWLAGISPTMVPPFCRTADQSTLRLHLAHHLAVLLRTRGHKPSAPSHHGNLMHQLHPR